MTRTVERLSGAAGEPGVFAVASRSTPGRVYRVVWGDLGLFCPCPGYGFRGACRHGRAVVAAVAQERPPRALAAARRLEEIAKEFDCA
jgi:hypothetical protein